MSGEIVDRIKDGMIKNRFPVSSSEERSWRDSTRCMKLVFDGSNISDEATVFIEYNVPFSKSRIDFGVTGKDHTGRNTAVIIEMKGWEKGVTTTDKTGMVYADFYHEDVLHPSYQAWSYANYISNFNSEVVDGQIAVIPCACLYNMPKNSGTVILEDELYSDYTSRARIFYATDMKAFSVFIDQHIFKPDDGETLFRIENGKQTISASLQKSLRRVLTDREFFAPIDRQVDVYNTLLNGITYNYRKPGKKVYIVRGGPGTGKSVLALKLMSQLNGGYGGGNDFIHTLYVTKTSAPRAIYSSELTRLAKDLSVPFLFKGASDFWNCETDAFPVIIVDEAHRLTTRSSQFSKGKDQVKEIINAAKITVFFIDEDQMVSMQDLGTIDKIHDCAYDAGAEVISNGLYLETQFRCSGSGLYMAWVDDVLGIRESINLQALGKLPYDIEVVDTPEELVGRIKEKRLEGYNSRIVAGYCWDWKTKDKKGGTDISLDGGINLRWNTDTATWGNDDKFCEEIGCIHSSQGLEYQYGGVIIGEDMIYRKGKVITVPEARADLNGTMKGWKKDLARADRIIRNTYRTLMTRGMCGCYVYCLDKELSSYLKKRLEAIR